MRTFPTRGGEKITTHYTKSSKENSTKQGHDYLQQSVADAVAPGFALNWFPQKRSLKFVDVVESTALSMMT